MLRLLVIFISPELFSVCTSPPSTTRLLPMPRPLTRRLESTATKLPPLLSGPSGEASIQSHAILTAWCVSSELPEIPPCLATISKQVGCLSWTSTIKPRLNDPPLPGILAARLFNTRARQTRALISTEILRIYAPQSAHPGPGKSTSQTSRINISS